MSSSISTKRLRAWLWRRQYGRSHGTGLTVALIAASVDAAGGTLVTRHPRHFPMLPNLLVLYPNPTP
jgi:predicted nucleic acid-binding protein